MTATTVEDFASKVARAVSLVDRLDRAAKAGEPLTLSPGECRDLVAAFDADTDAGFGLLAALEAAMKERDAYRALLVRLRGAYHDDLLPIEYEVLCDALDDFDALEAKAILHRKEAPRGG